MLSTTQQKDFLLFLSYCLSPISQALPECAVRISWADLLQFAKKQSVVGVYWQGVKRMSGLETNRPSEDDVMEWMAEIAKLRKRSLLLFAKSADIAHRFHDDGFNCCILKGQGNALHYPMPELRTSGDIDIWVWSSDGQVKSVRREIGNYVWKSFPDAKMMYLHIDYPIYEKVPVEVHVYPSILNNPVRNKKLQEYFNSQKTDVNNHYVSYNSDGNSFCFPTPTDSFNRIFELCHIMHHEFDEGIGLRQLIDYFYLLRRGFTDEERKHDCELLSSFGMYRFAAAVMYIMKKVLGLEDKYLLMPPDDKAGRLLLL